MNSEIRLDISFFVSTLLDVTAYDKNVPIIAECLKLNNIKFE